jgi:hypothetical protein
LEETVTEIRRLITVLECEAATPKGVGASALKSHGDGLGEASWRKHAPRILKCLLAPTRSNGATTSVIQVVVGEKVSKDMIRRVMTRMVGMDVVTQLSSQNQAFYRIKKNQKVAAQALLATFKEI